QTTVLDQSAPAGVQDQRVPDDDQDRPVLLRVPAPEPAPRLVRPDAAQHRADKAQECGEADHAVGHLGQDFPDLRALPAGETAPRGYDDPPLAPPRTWPFSRASRR